MVRTIKIYGALGDEFGDEFKLGVRDLPELVRCLGFQIDGWFDAFGRGSYKILRDGKAIGPEHIELAFGGVRCVEIIPVAGGDKSGKSGLGKIIIGVLILATAIIAPQTAGLTFGAGLGFAGSTTAVVTFGEIALFGALVIASGTAQLISPQPEVGDASLRESPDQRASYLLNSQVNTTEPGGPVPLVYGRTRVGTITVSAGIYTEQIDITSDIQTESFFSQIYPIFVMEEDVSTKFRGFVQEGVNSTFAPEIEDSSIQPGTIRNETIAYIIEENDFPTSHTMKFCMMGDNPEDYLDRLQILDSTGASLFDELFVDNDNYQVFTSSVIGPRGRIGTEWTWDISAGGVFQLPSVPHTGSVVIDYNIPIPPIV